MKIAIFITVRLDSKRLPNKPLMEIKGKTTIEHLIERIKKCENVDLIVLCTTENREDQVFIPIVRKHDIEIYFGDQENVIKRHRDAAIAYNVDFIINVDGDDLFCEPRYIDIIAEMARKNTFYDIISTDGLPFGVNSFGYKSGILDHLVSKGLETGWGEVLMKDPTLQRVYISTRKEHKIDARMSLDYIEDFEFFKTVIESFNHDYSLEDIIHLLQEKPEIIEINKNVMEKWWDNYENIKRS